LNEEYSVFFVPCKTILLIFLFLLFVIVLNFMLL